MRPIHYLGFLMAMGCFLLAMKLRLTQSQEDLTPAWAQTFQDLETRIFVLGLVVLVLSTWFALRPMFNKATDREK